MFQHITVLKKEAIEGLQINPDGVYVDCTLGGAGHSRSIAKQLSANGVFIGLDQDDRALEVGKERLQGVVCRVELVKSNFRQLDQVLNQLNIGDVHGVLFDLGVSSPQLDEGERGFSYHYDAPLDMRMDPKGDLTAFEIVNSWSLQDISSILSIYGEERFARRIAHAIEKYRMKKPIETTTELAEIVKEAIPAATRRSGPHPARRSFQAIRIAVNDELQACKEGIEKAIQRLAFGGRICVITFHSLEDRICKHLFQAYAKGCICPPDFPICTCNQHPHLRLVNKKPILPAAEELEQNWRARSAKLRIAEKLEGKNDEI